MNYGDHGCCNLKFQYWVDPNAGDPKDAILVYCDMSSAAAATCIQPKPDMSDVTTVEGWHDSMDSHTNILLSALSDSLA